MDWASAFGQLVVVKWLSKNRHEGCTTDAMGEGRPRGSNGDRKHPHMHQCLIASCSGGAAVELTPKDWFIRCPDAAIECSFIVSKLHNYDHI